MLLSDCVAIVEKVLGSALDNFVQQAVSQPNSVLHGISVPAPAPAWLNLAVIILCVADIVAVIFIFRWKRWAFYLSVAASLILMVANVAGGASIMSAILFLVSPILLYLTLKMGGESCGWKQLK